MATPDGRNGTRIGSIRLPVLPDGLGDALWLLVVMRVGLGLLALYVWLHVSVPDPCHFEVARNGWATIPPLADGDVELPLAGVWQRWDACWYSKIATFGYEPGTDAVAFFPLFPLLMRAAAVPFGGDVALGGMAVSAVAYVLAVMGLTRLVTRDFDADVARRTVLFISVAPAALFLFAPFTEALFLALTVWAILAARERRWMLAAAVGALAALTRLQGLFLVLPLAWEAYCAWRERPPSPTARVRLPTPSSILAVVAPAVGLAAFLVFTSATLGRTPFDAQDAWGGREFHPPWEVFDAAVRWVVDRRDSIEAANVIGLAIFLAVLVAGVRRLPLSYTLLAAPQVLLLAVRIQPTPLTSTTRYLEVVFPVFVLIALALGGRRRELTWVIVSSLLLAALTWTFVMGDFVA